MGCNKCRKKGVYIQCMACKGSFCTGCIQLEVHSCDMMQEKIKNDLQNLEKRITFALPAKLEKL